MIVQMAWHLLIDRGSNKGHHPGMVVILRGFNYGDQRRMCKKAYISG